MYPARQDPSHAAEVFLELGGDDMALGQNLQEQIQAVREGRSNEIAMHWGRLSEFSNEIRDCRAWSTSSFLVGFNRLFNLNRLPDSFVPINQVI